MEIEITVYTSNKMNKEVDILVDSKKKAFSQNANERMNLMKMSYSYTIYNDTIYSFHYKSLYYEDETVVNQMAAEAARAASASGASSLLPESRFT